MRAPNTLQKLASADTEHMFVCVSMIVATNCEVAGLLASLHDPASREACEVRREPIPYYNVVVSIFFSIIPI